jgi:uncharacterized membrane protein YeaQ/YmgE (transglycosylase-associated protein family)
MDMIIWLLAGAAIGWGGSVYLGTEHRQGLAVNVVVAVIGAAVGCWAANLLFGPPSADGGFRGTTVFASLVGAAVMLTVIHMVQQRAAGRPVPVRRPRVRRR